MTLDQLIVFIEIVDTGSYRKAAESLYRSQPALTQSIKKLEEDLDLQLFTRDSYRPTLTPAGTIFLKRARHVVQEMQSLKVVGQELGMGNEAQIRIALDIICPAEGILQVINTVLAQQSPHTELFVFTEVLAGGCERLLHQEADIAIMPMHSKRANLMGEHLLNVEMIAVCARDYMQNLQVNNEKDLMPFRQIVLSDSAKKIEKLSDGVVENARQTVVTDIHLKKTMIALGLGWGYMPEHFVRQELALGSLVRIEIKKEENDIIPISLVRNTAHAMGPLTHAIWEALLQQNFM